MARVTLTLSEDEKQALIDLAIQERRFPRDQGALLLRQALASAGYLQQAAIKVGQPAQFPYIEVQG